MDHLDLAGIMTTPPQWNTPVFDQQDAIYLSSSRQMLEPIMEETSEDEEYALNSWNQYDSHLSDGGGGGNESSCSVEGSGRGTGGGASFWSSAESDTGSVIRVEITKDNDSTSERDILCPAKRARRCEDSLLMGNMPANEDEVILRRPFCGDMKNSSLERFLNYENFSRDSWGTVSNPQRNSLGNRRTGGAGGFDDFFSDTDSLSYNSLSRSSSLIQFESLERQLLLQEQHASMNSLGNSSPSLLSFDTQSGEENASKSAGGGGGGNSANNSGNNSRRGSQSSLLKKYESLDGRLHQTYYDLDKLNFDDMEEASREPFGQRGALKLSTHLAELRSDSESSSEGSEGSSRPQSVLLPCDSMDNEYLRKFQRTNSQQSKKGKSSAENLSEDSGYCEPMMGFAMRRSKSQNLCKNYEKFSEEDEELMEHKSLSLQYTGDFEAREVEETNEATSTELGEKANKHSNLKGSNEFKNTSSPRQQHGQQQQQQQTPPTSPLLDYMRHKQRNATHSPSPVSSEVSTSSIASSKNSACSSASTTSSSASSSSSSSTSASSSSSGSGSSTSSATTCASKASFTWLMPSTNPTTMPTAPQTTTTPPRVFDRHEDTLRISLNDQRERRTSSNGKDANEDHKKREKIIANTPENEPKAGGTFSLSLSLSPADRFPNFVSHHSVEESAGPHATTKENQYCANCLSAGENEKFQNLNCQYCQRLENLAKIEEQNLAQKISEQQRKLDLDFNEDLELSNQKHTPHTPHHHNHQHQHHHPEEPRDYFVASNSSESDYSPAGIRKSLQNLMQHWPERTSSVPNELNSLGRKKKYKRCRSSKYNANNPHRNNDLALRDKTPLSHSNSNSSEDLPTADSLEEVYELKRSSSWCFESFEKKTSPTALEFPYTCSNIVTNKPKEIKNLGLLHQSYHNLALLDLESKDQTEYLLHNKMAEKRLSSDLETDIVCKSNFLLDELSAHYDRTASILNDRPLSKERDFYKTSDETDGQQQQQQPLVSGKPKVPQRRRKSSNSSYSENSENTDDDQVQHVQLVIRQPPARQKRHPHDQDKANSLTQDYTFSSIMQGKTFDQDPTMLRTSYAQSLEKCNFDCSEISQTDLSRSRSMPKRRFQTQASSNKKKNLVSSTPNLNAFQQDERDLEDDMYVSSATTSMHQLPLAQTQKPLGILVATGSKSSIGKGVSFCPTVSKYSWQEQSSEECHDGSGEIMVPTVVPGAAGGSEESDDELLDNCDAVVLKNTKENENIGNLYRTMAQQEEQQTMQEKYKAVIKELPTIRSTESPEDVLLNKEKAEEHLLKPSNLAKREQKEKETENTTTPTPPPAPPLTTTTQCPQANVMAWRNNETLEHETDGNRSVITTATFSLTTNVNNETLNGKPDTSALKNLTPHNETSNNSLLTEQKRPKPLKPTIVIARPISIQLPILSEPPINRAHHILYASQQMLDNFQRHQENEINEHSNKSQSVQNLNRMSSQTGSGGQVASASGGKINNNNEVMKSKFKADEKHPNSKGFLSRFTNGFRFSMRRNKKKPLNKEANNGQQVGQEQQQQQGVATTTTAQTPPTQNNSKKQKANGTSSSSSSKANKNQQKVLANQKQQQPDYIYIPLKGPLPEKYETGFFESHNTAENTSGNTGPMTNVIGQQTNGNALNATAVQTKLATVQKKGGKTSGEQKVMGKPPLPPQAPQQLQLQQQQLTMQKPQSAQSSQQQIGSSRFYTNELSSSAAAYQPPSSTSASTEDFLANERQHSQRQSFANDDTHQNNANMSATSTAAAANAGNANYEFGASPSRATVSQKTQMFNNLSSRNSAVEPKIGLIETNLDTHETIITGKTRSLMNIGPHHMTTVTGKRLHSPHSGGGGNTSAAGMDGRDVRDGDYDYDDNDDDEVVVRPDGTVVVIKNAGSHHHHNSGSAQIASVRRPHKSMEFLLDKENQKDVMPPENELQKSHDHNPAALSEHQLRIQASLQRLNIPDWFRQYNQKSPDGAGTGGYKPGNFTRKRTQDSGRWAGLNSKTTSLSSLGSQRSDRSPLLLSPSAHSHHGGQSASGHGPQTHHHGGVGVGHSGAGTGASGGAFSRWSTSHLNSSQTSPSVSQRGSFSRGGPINSSFISVNSGHSSVIRNSMRQPYLGWRSQEKLSQRTAHERLASSLLSQQQRTSPTTNTPGQTAANRKLQPVTPEIQSSIKEVTSAIVHYVNDQTNQQRSRSTSPNSRKCWLESSFVGIRPLDSPQTPVIEGAPFIGATAANLRPGNINNNNSFHIANHNIDAGNATVVTASAFLNSSAPLTGNDLQQLTRMNNGGLNNGTTSTSSGGGGAGVGGVIHYPVAPERSLSNASLEDVLASLLGLNPHPQQPLSGGNQPGSSSLASDAFARSSTGMHLRRYS
ncbi:serine-rich adhesin for platelets isoform X3 [Stomoxys calcitrans]|uniref:serine-rich adhesin for platelets isoform X3 n=1 Tax=Stomoxys calcitrans TaxID=35570 RepID=UPI0027E2B080|nr:serine-rich adhesin for platelets isoform X3 [Stomoxys calcitrans]